MMDIGQSIFEGMIDMLKFKGFWKEPFKNKIKWLWQYPIVAIIVGFIFAQYFGSMLLSGILIPFKWLFRRR